MKYSMVVVRLFVPIFLFFVTFSTAQRVVEIVDGRTIIVEDVNKVKFLIQLQRIEIPTKESSMSSVVKDHLAKLAIGKIADVSVNYTANNINNSKVIVEGIDLSQQMLRDGAAWYDLQEDFTQDMAERSMYLTSESLARNEKRGIWGVQDLKPSWERSGSKNVEEKKTRDLEEKIAEAKRLEERLARKRKEREEANANVKLWPDAPEFAAETPSDGFSTKANGDLTLDYDIYTDKGFVSTPVIKLLTTSLPKLFAVQYHFSGPKPIRGGNSFKVVIAVVDHMDPVIIVTDKGERINLGGGYRPSKSAVTSYNISKSDLIKLSSSKRALIRMGVAEAVLDDSLLNAIRRLLEAS